MDKYEIKELREKVGCAALLENEGWTSAETDMALIDWAVAGDDIASSIAQVPHLDDYAPDGTAFPLWPRRAF
jgi:hypothetical protein